MKRALCLLPTLLALFLLAACDSNTPPPTSTPQSNIGGPTFPPAVGTEAVPINTSVVTPITQATATIADTNTAQVGTFLSGFPHGVTRMSWSPDGTLLATAMGGFGGRDVGPDSSVIWVWNLLGEPVGQWKGHTGGVMAVQWSPDGETLASGSPDGTVVFWSRNGTPKATLQTNAGLVFSLDWAPNGNKLAVGALKSTNDNTAQIWSRDGTLEKTLHTRFSGGKFYNVLWSPDGKYLLGGATDYSLWDSSGNVITTTLACASCTPAWASAWSPDSKAWAIGDENGYVELHDTTGARISYIQARTSVNYMAWSPDGSTIALANELWMPFGAQVSTLSRFRTTITSLDWSPDSTMIAASSSGVSQTGLVGIFDPKGVELYRAESSDGQVNYVKWSPDGKILAVAYENKAVRLLHVENGTVK